MPRKHLDLCGLWRFAPDPAAEGTAAGYYQPDYDIRRWGEAGLPCTFEECAPDLDAYQGDVWFRRVVHVPAGWEGKRVTLEFAGVNHHAEVWVNGQRVGMNRDGFLPFALAVHDPLAFGQANTIAVRVDNLCRPGDVPGAQRGWRASGGILREVSLQATDPLRLAHVTVVADPGPPCALSVRARVENERPRRAAISIEVEVLDAEGSPLARLESADASLSSLQEGVLLAEGPVAGAKAWSPASPHLYTLRVRLRAGDEVVDQCDVRTGFRAIQVRDGQLWLNGAPLYLTGFNRLEDAPQRGMAAGLDAARRDLEGMRAAGANFVRLCHYPHHPGELDLCDELGMLAMGEIPLYGGEGQGAGKRAALEKLAAAKRQLASMIRRDVNHPALLLWSVSAETDETHPEVVEGNRELVYVAQELDPTRPAAHVSSRWQPDPHFDADDVICINAHPTLDAWRKRGRDDSALAASTRFWQQGLEELHERYPNKPLLVTEFGHPAFKDVHDGAYAEEAQARAIEAEFAGMQAPYVCGAVIGRWADHAWPQAPLSSGRLGVGPYGVVTRDRRRKEAWSVVQRLFLAQRGAPLEPKAPQPPQMTPAGYPVVMIRPHMRDIPQVPFPEGYSARSLRPDDGGLWVDVWRDAEGGAGIGADLFQREFGHDPQAIGRRCFFIVNELGLAVGTISAWYERDLYGQDAGRIHWVAVRRAYQRRGLGRAGMTYALNQMARWHDRAVLGTQTRRLPAIRLYLDYGFLPDLNPFGAIEVWQQVADQLDHPLLQQALDAHEAGAPLL